ncbi:MAG: ABC transporter permease [Gemmatimonadota bacterium]
MSIRSWVARGLALVQKRRHERDLNGEILAHLELAERDAIAAGLTPEQARREARRRFGGVEQMKEEHRDQRGVRWIDTLLKDARYGVASLVRDPGFTAVAVGVLALGIGANTAMFSLMDAVLFRPMPFPEPERIVGVWETPTPTSINQTSTATFLEWKRLSTSFEALSAETRAPLTATIGDEPLQLSASMVSADHFKVFGVKAAVGRTFAAGEDRQGAPLVAILSHAVWVSRFGSDSRVLDRDILLDGLQYRIVGVLPAGSFDRSQVDVWTPLFLTPDRMNGSHWLAVAGRLAPGVTLRRAQTEMLRVRAAMADQIPLWKKAWSVGVEPYDRRLIQDDLRRQITVGVGAVALVLLIACANVANLLLARGVSRRKEMAVRSALGASRGRLVAQLLTESLVLCLVGGAAGVLVATVLVRAAVPLLGPSLPFTAVVGVNGRVLGFAGAVALGAAILVGLLPSLQISSGNLARTMNQTTRGSSGSRGTVRRVIVVGEVAASLVLVCGALLLLKSLFKLQQLDVGARIENVIAVSTNLPAAGYPTPERAAVFYGSAVEQLRALPGVERVTVTQDVPLEGVKGGELMTVPGFAEPMTVRFKRVDEAYLATLEVPLVAGRGIAAGDRAGAPLVVMINEELARRLAERFQIGSPIGRTIGLSVPSYENGGTRREVQIVGVIRNERVAPDLRMPIDMVVYASLAQVPRRDVNIIVRARGEPSTLMPGIREAIRKLEPRLALADVRTLEQVRAKSLSGAEESTWVIGAFAVIAGLLAALGLYGVLSQDVTQRRREIGIRMALGADTGRVLWQVLRSALSLVAVGLIIGVAGAAALTRVLQGLLFEVSSLDGIAFGAACVVMVVIGALAGLVPAGRAAKVDPMVVIRDAA